MSQANFTFEGVDLRDGALQKITEKRVWPQIQHGHFMWNKFGQKRGVEVNSRKREIVHRLFDGQVPTFLPELTALPATRPESEVRSEFSFTKMLRGISFSPEAMEQMKQPSSLLSISGRLESYGQLVKSELARGFYGDGSGAVAVLADSGTITGTGPYVVHLTDDNDTFGGAGSRGVADIKVGSDYDLFLDDDSIQATVLVTDILSATSFECTVTAGSLAAGDLTGIVVPPGTREATTGTSYAFHGLAYHTPGAATGEWQGTDPSSVVQLRSVIKDMEGAGLTIGFVNYLEDAVRQRRADDPNGMMDKTLILSGVGQHAKLKAYLNSYRRADMGETVLKTGGREVENQLGNRWTVDIHCPDSRVYNVWEDDFAMAVLKELSYVDNGSGGKFVLRPDGTGKYLHVYDAWLTMMFEFVGHNPFKQAVLLNIGVDDIIKASETAYGLA